MGLVLFYTIGDADGDKSRVEFPVEDTHITLANVSDVIEDVWDLINPLVNGNLVSAGFSFEADVSGFTNVAAATIADVQEKAEFAWRTTAGFLKRINLPTFVETLFGGGGSSKDVNLADTNVAAFCTAMVSGIPQPDDADNIIFFTDSHEDRLDTLETARENWGRRRG